MIKKLSVQSKSIKYNQTAGGTAIYRTENCCQNATRGEEMR